MADVNVSFGLDAGELFAALKNVSSATTQTLNKLEQDAKKLGDSMVTNMAKGTGGISQTKRELSQFVDENRKALQAMQLNGEGGTKAYALIENQIRQAQSELKKIDDAAKQVDASLAGIGGGDGGGIGAKLSGAFDAVGASVGSLVPGLGAVSGVLTGGVTAGIAAVGGAVAFAVSKGRELISAEGDLRAQTGATGAEFEALRAAADEAFLGGVGESVAEATKVISNAKTVLKDALPNDELGKFVAGAQALGNLYDKDVNEVIAKSTPFIKQFGLSGQESFDLIAFAAKEGKTSQDDVLDTLAEYSQLLKEAGFSAEDFAGKIAVAGQEGIFNTDKIGDSIKEAQIRLKAGDTAKAFTDLQAQLPKTLATSIDALQKQAASGQINIKEFIERSGASIKEAYDAGQISEDITAQLQTAISGTPAEDLGAETWFKLFSAPIPQDEIKRRAAEAGQAASGAVGQYLTFDSIGRNINLLIERGSAVITQGLSDAFGMVAQAVGPTFQNLGETLSGYFERVWSVIGPILALIGGALIGGITNAINGLANALNIVLTVGNAIFDGLIGAIQPIIDVFVSLGQTIADALGFGDKAGGSIDFMQTFQTILNNLAAAGTFVADIIGGTLAGAISFLFTPLQLIGETIGFVIGTIIEWIKQTGIIQTVVNAATSTFDFFRGIVQSVQNAFNFVNATIHDLINFWNDMTEIVSFSGNIFDGFKNALNSVYEIIKTVGEAVFNFGVKILQEYFIEPIKTAIEFIGQIIAKIGAWVASFGPVRAVVGVIQDIARGVGDFFGNISKYIDIVKENIGGIVSAINEVGKLANEFFERIKSADFTGAYNTIANSVNRISEAYKDGKEAARQYMEGQKNGAFEVAKAQEKIKPVVTTKNVVTTETDKTTKDKDTKDNKDKEKAKTKDAETAFQERKRLYELEAKDLETKRNAELINFKGTEEEKSKFLEARLASDALKLNEYLNKKFQETETTDFLDTPVKIKPVAGKETEAEIQKFYTDIFLKNKTAIDKAANVQLKEQLKAEAELRKQQVAEAEKQYKELSEIIAADIKQNTTAIATAIPNVGAITQAQYDEAIKNADGFTTTLIAKNKFIEDQLVAAQIAGADKAAESLQKQLDANNALLNSARERLNAYIDASEVSLQNSTLANVAALAVQKGLYDVFLNDKTQAEREQLEQARQDKLNALRDEESDLETSLANREISFDEYQQKVAAIAEQRRAAEAEGEQQLNNIMANLKRAGETALGEIAKQESAKMITAATDKQNEITAAETELAAAQRTLNRTKKTDLEAYAKAEADVTEKTKKLADTDAQTYGFRTAVLEEFAGKAIEQFGALAASGSATIADAGKLALGLVVELLKKQIPIWVASIFGTTVGQLGPLGVLVAGGLTATLYALANEATAGFKTGGYTGDSGTDEVAGVVHGQEYVLNANATRQNRDVLEWANRTNRPISEYFRSHSLERQTYAVSDSGEIVLEVQKLREETRNLGVQIRRNTVVEVSGNLVGDGRSINAIIENNKRKSIKRG